MNRMKIETDNGAIARMFVDMWNEKEYKKHRRSHDETFDILKKSFTQCRPELNIDQVTEVYRNFH